MKTLTLLKIITIGLVPVILIGMAAVLYKVTDIRPKSNPPAVIQSVIKLDFPETVNQVLACGEKLCLMTVGHPDGHRLMIVDPEIGRLSAVLTLKDRAD